MVAVLHWRRYPASCSRNALICASLLIGRAWAFGAGLRARDGALLPGLRGLLALPLTFLLVLVLAFSFTPLSGRNSTPAASKARCRAVLETLRHARLLYHCLACPFSRSALI